MASKTGRSSVGEREMTLRISLVAVCCSTAVVRSVLRASKSAEQPNVSEGVDAWTGEALQPLALLVAEQARRPSPDEDAADDLSTAPHGPRKPAAPARRLSGVLHSIFGIGHDIGDVLHLT